MKKVDMLTSIEHSGVVSVVRGTTKDEAYQTALACIKGGVKAIELTFTVPAADEIIKQLNKQYAEDSGVVVGAGTVLDAVTARIAIMAGAKFVVSPSFDKETALICNEYQIPYLPGCMTVTEIQIALRYGADIIKVFPGSILGKGFVKAVKAPLPYVNIMPTGGVNLDNMHEWFEVGVVAVGAGSDLTGDATSGDFAAVSTRAQAYHTEYLRIKDELNK